jgi:hypothetical protein
MGVQQLHYYRLDCDHEGCRQLLNIAAPSIFELQGVLDKIKDHDGSHWVVTIVTQGPPSEIRAWCPEHMEDSNAAVLG